MEDERLWDREDLKTETHATWNWIYDFYKGVVKKLLVVHVETTIPEKKYSSWFLKNISILSENPPLFELSGLNSLG